MAPSRGPHEATGSAGGASLIILLEKQRREISTETVGIFYSAGRWRC